MPAGTADAVRVDLDGVPFFWVEAPPPYRVTLQFRVGRADESLAVAGVTHLCEHLALSGFHGASHPFNGSVELSRSLFFCQGSADQARRFLEGTCRQLGSLPVDRLDREKRILQTEASRRQHGIIDAMLFSRFGAKGYGLSFLPEYGLWTVDGDLLRDWAARWFTRGNAAGWIVGPELLPLEVPLPAGRRIPPPTPDVLPATLPAVTRLGVPIVGAAALTSRSTAATLALSVITRALDHALRFEMGAAYHVQPVYIPLTADTAWLSVTSDLSDTRTEETVDRFLAVLRNVATQGPGEQDVELQRSASIAGLDGHGWEVPWADFATSNELVGAVQTPRSALREECLSVSVDRDPRPRRRDSLRRSLSGSVGARRQPRRYASPARMVILGSGGQVFRSRGVSSRATGGVRARRTRHDGLGRGPAAQHRMGSDRRGPDVGGRRAESDRR